MVMVGTIKVPRVVVLIAVFMAGVLITAAVMWRLRTEPSAGIGSGTGGCGDVQVAGKDWLGGQGVDVRSNGAYQTKSTSCAYDDREVYDIKANPPIYGFIHAAKNTKRPNAAGPGGSGPRSTATYMDPSPLSFKITGFCTTVGGR